MAHERRPARELIGVRPRICHRINALHIYCRLRDLGLGKRRALRIARRYERLIKALKGR